MIYSKVEVQNFRCFEKITVDGLKQVNLITGQNNVGKTAFLETMFIMAGTSGELMLRTDIFRGMPGISINLSGAGATESPLNSFFHNFNTNKEIILRAENEGNWNKVTIKSSAPSTILMSTSDSEGRVALRGDQSMVLCEFVYENSKKDNFTNKLTLFPEKKQISFGENVRPAFFEVIFLHNVSFNPKEDADRLGRLLETKKVPEIVEALKILEPRIKDIKIALRHGDITILIDIGKDRLIPLALSGLGMIKVLRLIVSMLSVPGGVLLVDEIEVGLHWKALLPIWQVIEKIAKQYDVQVIATTHSLDCVRSAVGAFSGKQKFDLGVFRFEETKQGIQSVAYNEGSIKAAMENDLEVR